MDIYEVIFQHKTTGLTHTDIVQGRHDVVQGWAKKEADVNNCDVTHIIKTKLPETRDERNKIKIIR